MRFGLALTLVVVAGLFGARAEAQESLIEEIKPATPVEAPRPAPPKEQAPAPTKDKTPPLAKDKAAPTARTPAEEAGSPKEEGAADDALARGGIVVRQLSYDGILERWDARRKAVIERDSTKQKRLEQVFFEGVKDFGIQGRRGTNQAPDLAHALIAEAREAIANQDKDRAQTLVDAAMRLAPSLPAIHAFRVELALVHDTNPVSAGAAAIDLMRASFEHPRIAVDLVARASAAGLFTVMLLFFLVSAVALLRAFRYLAFDLHNALPRGAARWQVSSVLAIIALMPLLAGLGPVWTALFWLSLAWLYLEPREQVAFGTLAVLVGLSPFGLAAGARFFVYPETQLASVHEAAFDVAADAERDALAVGPIADRSVDVNAALFHDALREGRLDEALTLARELVGKAQDEGWVHNNVGVVTALLGDEEVALAAFRDAMNRNPPSVEAAYNTSLIRLRNPRLKSEDPTADALLSTRAGAVDAFRGLTYRSADEAVSQNRGFVVASRPLSPVADAYRSSSPEARQLVEEVGLTVYFGLSPFAVLGGLGVFVLLWVVLARSRSRLLPSTACRSCGAPASRRYDGPEVPAHTCSACFHVFERKGSTAEAGMQLRKERQRVAHRRQTRALSRLLSAAVPGLGHVYLASPERAVVFGILFVLSLAVLLFLSPIWPWPDVDGASVSFLWWAPPLVVAGLVWIFAYRSARGLSE